MPVVTNVQEQMTDKWSSVICEAHVRVIHVIAISDDQANSVYVTRQHLPHLPLMSR